MNSELVGLRRRDRRRRRWTLDLVAKRLLPGQALAGTRRSRVYVCLLHVDAEQYGRYLYRTASRYRERSIGRHEVGGVEHCGRLVLDPETVLMIGRRGERNRSRSERGESERKRQHAISGHGSLLSAAETRDTLNNW